jgi:hypothetical protein
MSTVEQTVPATAAQALQGLCEWLTDAVAVDGGAVDKRAAGTAGAGTAVRVALPEEGQPDGVYVWPVALLPDQGTRGGSGREPLRLRARCAVFVHGPVDVALDLLDRVLLAAAGTDRYRLALEPVPALPVPPRTPWPAVLIDVPVRVVPPAAKLPRVTSELRLAGGAVRAIRGQLLGPGGIPLAGMTVTAPGTGAGVSTDERGDFVLPGQPAGRTVALHLSGRGLHLQVDVPPEATDPVVIHCDLEEV